MSLIAWIIIGNGKTEREVIWDLVDVDEAMHTYRTETDFARGNGLLVDGCNERND